MNNTYECMILVNNQEVRKGWQSCKQSIVDLFGKHKAEVVSARRWDERRLAYPIKGQQRATYLLVYFKSEHLTPAAIRRAGSCATSRCFCSTMVSRMFTPELFAIPRTVQG